MPSENESFTCEQCEQGYSLANNQVHQLRTNRSHIEVCETCYDDYVFHCEDCEEAFHNELYGYIVSINDTRWVCEDCYYENYVRCAECGWVMHNQSDDPCWSDRNEYYYCTHCYHGVCGHYENILDWGNDPSLRFVHGVKRYDYQPRAKTYYLGIEIELEDAAPVINDMIGEFDQLWAKTDSSLGYDGVEVCSHPGTLEAWNNNAMIDFDRWRHYVHNVIPNQSRYDTNGIHVHVSRTAFKNAKGLDSAAHLYRFMQFIQNHEQTVQLFAKRKGNSYCQWDGDSDAIARKGDAMKKDYGERYRPVNVQNEQTIELRFFDGQSDPRFILACIHFTAAVVEFTRNLSVKDKAEWGQFAAWVRKHAKDYSALYSMLAQNNRAFSAASVADRVNKKQRQERIAARKRAEKERIERRRREQAEREAFIANYRCDCQWCARFGR